MTDINHGPVTAPPAPADGLAVVARAHVRSEDDGLYADLEVLNGEQMQPDHSPVPLVLKSDADALIADLQGLIVTHEICAEKQRAEIERLRGLLEEAREGFRTVRDYIADEIAYADHPSASVSPSIRQMMNDDMARIDAIITKIGEPR